MRVSGLRLGVGFLLVFVGLVVGLLGLLGRGGLGLLRWRGLGVLGREHGGLLVVLGGVGVLVVDGGLARHVGGLGVLLHGDWEGLVGGWSRGCWSGRLCDVYAQR